MSIGERRTFIVKAVYPVDTGTFVITAENEEVFGIFDLVREEEADGFQRLFPSVYIVSEEQIVCFWRKPSVLEESQEVVVLAVNVTWRRRRRDVLMMNGRPERRTRQSDIPQILMGASSSSRMGWLMKISLAFVHRYLISYSANWTGFPGRLPRTGGRKIACQHTNT